MNRNLRGITCTLLSGVFWGLSGACSEYLFTNYNMDSRWLTVCRLMVTGIVLTTLTLLLHRDRFIGILSKRADATQLVAFGLLGLMFSQFSYLTSIKYSNSGGSRRNSRWATISSCASPSISARKSSNSHHAAAAAHSC